MTATTTERGLGWAHQRQVKALFAGHVDGTECWWCGRGMYREPSRNFDQAKLEGDHTITRSTGGTVADRLMHRQCNRERGDGSRDHLRPSLGGIGLPPARTGPLGVRVMAWPRLTSTA